MLSDECRRLANDLHQKDFMTNIVEKVRFGEVSEEELTAHAATLVYVNYLMAWTLV